MSEQGAGWVPTEAQDDLETRRDGDSLAAADAILALPPRDRVLALMRLVASGRECKHPLRPADLARVLASFEGEAMPLPPDLAAMFPDAVAERG